MASGKLIGLVYAPKVPEALPMALALDELLKHESPVWMCAAEAVEEHTSEVERSRIVITIGGDGTILRATRVAAQHGIPLLGINMGRVGFMTELSPGETLSCINEYLGGKVRIEKRTMLQAQVIGKAAETTPSGVRATDGQGAGPIFHGLNDAVVGRGSISRIALLEVRVDGALVGAYAADAIIISTATGSTGYSLAAGGPILHTQSESLLLKPVAPHLGLGSGILLAPDSIVDLTVQSRDPALLSVDGFPDVTLIEGDTVQVQRSPHMAHFLRKGPDSKFYETLHERLWTGERPSRPPQISRD
jgi:NAD+ kinase